MNHDSSDKARKRLQAASQSKDVSRQVAVGLSAVTCALFVLLLVAMIDYRFLLPRAVRWFALGGLAAIVIWSMRQLWLALRIRTSLKEAALDLENEKQASNIELSTAAEYLTGERKVSRDYEQDLVSALHANAAKTLDRVSPSYWKRPLRQALLLGFVLFGSVLFVAMSSGSLTAFQRAAVPWTTAAYTQVEVKPGDLEVPIGKDLEIASVFSGRKPSQAHFEWQPQGSTDWQMVPLTSNDKGEYLHSLKAVQASLKYRVSGGDAVSKPFTIEAYLPPDVKTWDLSVQPPAYTKRPVSHQSAPDIEVLRASIVTFRITPNVPLKSAELKLKSGALQNLAAQPDGSWTGQLSVTKDDEYWIQLADPKGHKGGNEKSFRIAALTDRVPKVEILEPGEDRRAATTNNLPIKISATDDFGLTEFRLVYHKLGGPQQVISAKRNQETNSEWSLELPLSILNLQENELVAYHAEAVDNNTLDGPGVGRSDVFFVEITNQPHGGESKSPSKGQKVNLLVLQKQIIADTTTLAANAPPEKFDELAKRQKDAIGFGKLYQDALVAAGASPTALSTISGAVKDMQSAEAALEKKRQGAALPPEETALAKLYSLLQQMPELEDLPIKPTKPKESKALNVALEAIKKKKDKEKPDNKDLKQALEDLKELAAEQESLTLGVQNTGAGKGQGKSEINRAPKSGEQKLAKNDESKGEKGQGEQGQKGEGEKGKGEGEQGKGQGEGQQPGKGKGKAGQKGQKGKGQGQGQKNAKNEKAQEPKPDQADKDSLEELAEKEEELSQEAKELADKFAQLAGKDSRLGHGIAKKMNEAGNKMSEAAQAMQAGNSDTAGTKGMQAGAGLRAVASVLERILNERPQLADVSREDFPKEYEAAIADYLKKLSYAE